MTPLRALTLGMLLLGLATPRVSSAQQTAAAPGAAGVLRGQVRLPDGVTPAPRTRVIVEVDGTPTQLVATDDTGRFEVPVPSGRHSIRIEKSSHVPQVHRRDRAATGPLDVTLVPAALVTGRVVDPSGQPVVNATVRIRRVGTSESGLVEASAETNDRGEFRIGGLAAGRYAAATYPGVDIVSRLDGAEPEAAARMLDMMRRELSARPPSSEISFEIARGQALAIDLAHPQAAVTLPYAEVGGAVSGVLVDQFGEPATDVLVRLWQIRFSNGRAVAQPFGPSRATDDRGHYRLYHIPAGRYIVAATPGADPWAIVHAGQYLPIYFPGRLSVGDAWSVSVGRGQEILSTDMTVDYVRGARVHGVARDASGQPLAGTIALVASQAGGPTLPPQHATRSAPSATTPDGAFERRNVPPGNYALQAIALRDDDHMDARITEFTVQRIAVGTADVGPILLRTTPTATMSGTIAREQRDGVEAREFGLAAVPDDPDEAPHIRGLVPDMEVQPDWTFRIDGITGRSRIVLTRGASGWWLKSADVGGLNAAEDPVDVGARSRDDVSLVLAPTGASVAGRVLDEERRGVDSYIVVLFAADRRQWFSGSRYLRSTDPAPDGRFSIASLAPGEYRIAAVEAGDGDTAADWRNPDVLEDLALRAESVSLSEGQLRTLDLRLTRLTR